jgi:uncharacterized protein
VTVYYLDTSALVKRYAREQGSSWVTSITDPASGHEIYTVLLTGPELIAALFRKARTQTISEQQASQAASIFKVDYQSLYLIIDVTFALADAAMTLAERQGLRGYDAVHLAAAVLMQRDRNAYGLPPLVFVSADDAQVKAALREGLVVDNPNSYT